MSLLTLLLTNRRKILSDETTWMLSMQDERTLPSFWNWWMLQATRRVAAMERMGLTKAQAKAGRRIPWQADRAIAVDVEERPGHQK